MARMTLDDFRMELLQRGFDGFLPADLDRYINFGYKTVGRLTKWRWEEGAISQTMAPGVFRWTLASDLPTVKSVRAVVITTTGYECRLTAIMDDDFYSRYGAYDLSASQNRGEPIEYWLNNTHLYILPPPRATRAFTVTAEQILVDLTAGQSPITPAEYDEAILIAAEEQCHLRARQPEFANVNRKKLSDFLEDALVDEATNMQDLQERIIPGRTTL